jgi:N-acetylglucosaminyldiphosphoundecaprenol N-acetyl-beta-D-mannosaminyltransferase
VFCDGDGVRLGARLAGKRLREKITYNRWIWEIAAVSAARGHRWYRHPGYFAGPDEVERLIVDINRREPHILVLGMGMPTQEAWLADHLDRLHVNVALTGGAVFDYASGRRRTTPDVFRRLKLEWLYRWAAEPRRLFWRYAVGNPLFIGRVLMWEVLMPPRAAERR